MATCQWRISQDCHTAKKGASVCKACWNFADENKKEDYKLLAPGHCEVRYCWEWAEPNMEPPRCKLHKKYCAVPPPLMLQDTTSKSSPETPAHTPGQSSTARRATPPDDDRHPHEARRHRHHSRRTGGHSRSGRNSRSRSPSSDLIYGNRVDRMSFDDLWGVLELVTKELRRRTDGGH